MASLSLRRLPVTKFGTVDADDLTIRIDQGTAGSAGVDRRIGLNELHALAFSTDSTIEGLMTPTVTVP